MLHHIVPLPLKWVIKLDQEPSRGTQEAGDGTETPPDEGNVMGKTEVGGRNCCEAGEAETDETADDDALPLAAVRLLGKELGGLPDQHEESDEWVENELEGLHEAAFTCGVHSFSKGFYENRVVLFARDSEKLKTRHLDKTHSPSATKL